MHINRADSNSVLRDKTREDDGIKIILCIHGKNTSEVLHMFQLAVLSWDGMVASVGKEKPFLFVCVLANYSRKKEVRHLISCMGIGKCCFYYYITCSQISHENEEPWNALLYMQTKRRLQIQMGCRFRYNTRKLLGDTRNLNSITTRERWYLIFYDSSSVSSRSQFLFSFFSKNPDA